MIDVDIDKKQIIYYKFFIVLYNIHHYYFVIKIKFVLYVIKRDLIK